MIKNKRIKMLMTNIVTIKINGKEINHYKKLGFNDIKFGDIIEIPVFQLPLGSHIKVKTICDVCNCEKEVEYRYYLDRIKIHDIFCCSVKCSRIKTNKTNLKKYGSISPTQNKEILKKREETYLKKYGFVTNLLCEDTKEKIKNSCLNKFGVEFPSQNEEIKKKIIKTSLEKYGVEHPSQNKEIMKKTIKTSLEKYGVEHPSQNEEIHKKQLKSSFKKNIYENISYQGTYELDFLKNFSDKVKIERPKSIKYNYNGKTKNYFPDFYLPEYNLIVEIKNSWLIKKDSLIIEEKRKSTLENGFKYIIIINKDYNDFLNLVSL